MVLVGTHMLNLLPGQGATAADDDAQMKKKAAQGGDGNNVTANPSSSPLRHDRNAQSALTQV